VAKTFSHPDQNRLEGEEEETGAGDLSAVVERPVLTTDVMEKLIYL